MQYLDSRISKISKPTTTNSDDLTFKGEGNKVQFKFNSERSSKLSEILECLQSRNYETAEDIIKSEISQIGQRNKIIKIADRHGWDVVKEYTIHPLADDNDDAVKLRVAINRANRRRPKPYDRSVQPTFADVESFFVANINQQRQKLARNRQHFNHCQTVPIQKPTIRSKETTKCHNYSPRR